ncbi:site-specific integrase [Micromonospora viridifaciens]|uniref:hypothetical protein n=1 Tax=Micromonospora viridifaciens TaxID=1881 RepID=UPI000B5ABF0B|nr:hypothetical protein [Micromonospora viridifaciens]
MRSHRCGRTTPLEGLALPDGPKFERDILETPEDAALFLTATYEVDPEAADLLLTKLATGLRWGEVAALTAESVRAHLGTVEVRQVLRKVNRQWVVEPKPKTKKGYRSVPVHPMVMEMLKRRAAAARGSCSWRRAAITGGTRTSTTGGG